MSTIKDIARDAGVSTATVSRFLNSTAKVSPETAKKIMKAVKKYNYEPNFLGRGLRVKRTNMVMVILSSIVNSFYAKVIKGVEDEAHKNGYNVLIAANYDSAETERSYTKIMKKRLVDGMIFMRPSIKLSEMDALYKKYPIVQCAEYIPGSKVPYVSIDHRKAAYDMVCGLINRGLKRIGAFYAKDGCISSSERFQGYKDALNDAGIPFDESLVAYGNHGFRNARSVAAEYIRKAAPEAVFAFSDRMAAGVIRAAMDLDLKVPEDISVAGFDNIDLSHMMTPAITTVSQNQYDMGALAMRKLLELIEGKQATSEFLDYEIVWRESVK